MFTKEERSSFKYWFAHWCAFQMTALNNKCWKFKYLFHDIEKPWLMLIWKDYSRVQKWHRTHNSHHLEYKNKCEIDYEAMAIDWECSRFTKDSSPRTAYEELCKVLGEMKETCNRPDTPILDKIKISANGFALEENMLDALVKTNLISDKQHKFFFNSL